MKSRTFFLLIMCAATSSLLSAQGLKVEPGSCIKVELGTTLKIANGDLVLKSNASGDASLIDLGNVEYLGSGEAKVERYLTHGKWHLVSSPVSGAVAGMFTGDYLQTHSEATNVYTDVTLASDPLNIMQGYALWCTSAEATTELFSGITNTKAKSIGFTKSGDGWNLVGNPYPSVLDWDKVTIPGQLSGAIWLFDPTVGANGDYRYYINGGGLSNTTTQYIPSGQGFFVRATFTPTLLASNNAISGQGFFVRATGEAGTLTLQNDARVHGGQTFYKASETNQMLLVKATGNGITTQTAIRFIADATQQADRLYDVFKIMSGSPDVPNVYTQIGNEKMAINTLPGVSGNEIVPMYFEAGMDGIYTFDACEIESLDPEVPVFLEDMAANYFQDLRDKPSYSFGYTSGAVKDFRIHFKNVTGIEETETFNVSCYLSNEVLYVNFPEQEMASMAGGAILSLYSLSGQQLMQTKLTQRSNAIPFSASRAVYLVKITTDGRNFSTKVFNH